MDFYFPFTATDPTDTSPGVLSSENLWRKMGRQWLPSGVIPDYLNALNGFADSTGLHMKMDTGAAWVDGHYGEITALVTTDTLSSLAAVTGGLSRVDRLVLRVDPTNKQIVWDVLTGVPGTPGVEPALTQILDAVYEYPILRTKPMNSLTTTLAPGDVFDERGFTGVAGGVLHGGVVSGTANVTGAAPSTATIITSPTLIVPPNRVIEIDYSSQACLVTGPGALIAWELVRDSTVLASWSMYYNAPGAGSNEPFERTYFDVAPAAGPHVYLVRWATTVSASGIDVATATQKRLLAVKDVGAA
jgi:hypothetical protein